MPRSALLLGSVVAASLMMPPGFADGIGIAPAAAATESAGKKAGGRRVAVRTPATGVPKAGTRRVRFTERKGFAKARYAALPKFMPEVALRPALAAPLLAGTVPKPDAPTQTGSVLPSPAKDGASLPPDRVIATASITPAPVIHPGAERMRPALEARARSMASDLGLFPVPLPEAAPVVQISARSVTFDLEKGQRTIVFGDGASVTAPFDKNKASDLTGLKPSLP